MTAKIVNGREIAQQVREEVAKELAALLATTHIPPTIATITVGEDPSSVLYLKLRQKACQEVGINSTHLSFPQKTSQEKILHTIEHLNSDPTIHGIFIQTPLPKHLTHEHLISALDPQKDVEGLHPVNLGKTLIGVETLIPCTPAAVLMILDHEHISVQGKDIVIINHSTIVGKPLAALLLNRNATTSVCHVFTKNLTQYTTQADILVTAAGVPGLITEKHVKDHAVVIDVAVIETKTGICGDVDAEQVKEKVSLLTPVPGGVGPVTIAASLKNMVITYKNCIIHK